jgi:hypothetical protein
MNDQQQKKQKNSHYNPSHSHQPHIPRSNIAQLPNIHWMKPSGEVSAHPANTRMLYIQCICEQGEQKKVAQQKWCKNSESELESINKQTNKNHQLYFSHSQQHRVSQISIERRQRVHWMMPSGEACLHSVPSKQNFSRKYAPFFWRYCVVESIHALFE